MKEADAFVRTIFEQELSVATAESCTGGMIAAELCGYAGMSAHFAEGYVTYANEAKVKNVHVKQETLDAHGAVSRETAAEMALGVKRQAGSDIGLATTGIAGPDGGTYEKPVGLVYIGCAYQDKVTVRKYIFKGSRYQVRYAAMRQAFRLASDVIKRQKR